MPITLDDETIGLLKRALQELDRARNDARSSVREAAVKAHEDLDKALDDLLSNRTNNGKQRLLNIAENLVFVTRLGTSQPVQRRSRAEEYVKGWLETLIMAAATVSTLSVVALGFIPKIYPYVSLGGASLLAASVVFFLFTALSALKAHGKLTYAIAAGQDGYVASIKWALWARRFFIIGLVSLSVAMVVLTLNFLPILSVAS